MTPLGKLKKSYTAPQLKPKEKSPNKLLKEAVANADAVAIKPLIIQKGANPNIKDQKGWTALHYASYLGNAEVVKVLLECNVDARQVDKEGKNALHIALEKAHKAVAKVLVEAGVDSTAPDNSGVTPLKIARDSVVRQVLENELVEMIEQYSDLQIHMEKAEAVSKKFRFQVRMCTTFVGMFMMVAVTIFAALLFKEVLSQDKFGGSTYYFATAYIWAAIALLGIQPNDVLAIRILSLFLVVFLFGWGIASTDFSFTMLFVERYEFRDYDRETTEIDTYDYRNYYCGSDLPNLGCGIVIGRSFCLAILLLGISISLFQNIRKVKGDIKVYDRKRDQGQKYNDHAFKKAARSALDNIWFTFLLVSGCTGFLSVTSGCVFLATPDRAVWFTKQLFVDNMIYALWQVILVFIFTPFRRRRIMAVLTSMIAQHHVRLAACVTALLGRRNVTNALNLATDKFHTITFENLAQADYRSCWEKYDTTFSKTVKGRLGSCDAFVSHSWSDNGSQKFDALCSWALEFKAEHAREPQLWLDKDCIEKSNLSEDLACLPFFLSGCKKFIILAGPTYTERLWCIMEVFLFLNMGGTVNQIEILPIDGRSKNTVKQEFEKIDVDVSKCEGSNTKHMLLGAIEAGFGSTKEFNRIMRQVFKSEKASQMFSMKEALKSSRQSNRSVTRTISTAIKTFRKNWSIKSARKKSDAKAASRYTVFADKTTITDTAQQGSKVAASQ